MNELTGIGVEIVLKEGEELVSIPLSKEVMDEIFPPEVKSAEDYIKEYMDNNKLYRAFHADFQRLMNECIPSDIECKYCIEKTGEEKDRACTRYYLQMRSTYYLASVEFVSIVQRNRHLIHDKKVLKRMAGRFVSCFYFIKDKGVLWFDLPELMKLLLSEGLLSISEQFSKSDTLNNLAVINNTLDDLSTKEITRQLTNEPDYSLLYMQKKFFEEKQAYFERKLSLDKEIYKRSKVFDRPYKIDIALFAYYVYQFDYTLNKHSFPSVKFWEALATEFDVHYKGIQQKFNDNRKTESRISAKNVESIEFVANEMLKEYPEAQALALDELKMAKLK